MHLQVQFEPMLNTVAPCVFVIGLVGVQVQQTRLPETDDLIHCATFSHGDCALFCSQQFDPLWEIVVHIHWTAINFFMWILTFPFVCPVGNVVATPFFSIHLGLHTSVTPWGTSVTGMPLLSTCTALNLGS